MSSIKVVLLILSAFFLNAQILLPLTSDISAYRPDVAKKIQKLESLAEKAEDYKLDRIAAAKGRRHHKSERKNEVLRDAVNSAVAAKF